LGKEFFSSLHYLLFRRKAVRGGRSLFRGTRLTGAGLGIGAGWSGCFCHCFGVCSGQR
jgi:hypothetical protein